MHMEMGRGDTLAPCHENGVARPDPPQFSTITSSSTSRCIPQMQAFSSLSLSCSCIRRQYITKEGRADFAAFLFSLLWAANCSERVAQQQYLEVRLRNRQVLADAAHREQSLRYAVTWGDGIQATGNIL